MAIFSAAPLHLSILTYGFAESFGGTIEIDEYGRPRCKNQDRLFEFIISSKFLLQDRRTPPAIQRSDKAGAKEISPLLAAIRIVCSCLLFEHEDMKYHVFAIEQLQRAAYAASNKAPIFEGLHLTDINMDWTMKCLDFFRYHMINEDASTLSYTMEELSPLQKPTAWQGTLKNGAVPLSKTWKGTYSFLDPKEQRKLRNLSADDDSDAYFSDKNINEGKIQVCDDQEFSGNISLSRTSLWSLTSNWVAN
jgi:hypothetical protein